MTLDNLPTPNFSGADLAARVNAAVVELRASRTLSSFAALVADRSMGYGTGSRPVAEGDIVRTTLQGFTYLVAAPDAADAHLTTARGVRLYVRPGERGWHVGAFGAKGDGAADDTAAFVMARTAAAAAGGGTIYAPGGTYVLHEFALTTASSSVPVALVGDYGATVIRARDAGKFAVTLGQSAFSQSWWGVSLRDLQFSGYVGGTKRMGCGLYAPREHRLENVSFTECLIGLVTGDNYYYGGRNLNLRDCFVGILNGTFGTGATTIGDLVNGAGSTVSVTLPFAMANAGGHSGNKHWDTIRINSCDIGLAGLGATVNTPHNLLTKASIESCGIGLLCIRGGFRLVQPWFENNATSGTVTFNGATYEKGAVVAGTAAPTGDLYESFGGQVAVDGGRVGRMVARDGGSIYVDGLANLFEADVTEIGTGRVRMDRVLTDNRSVSCLVQRPMPVHSTGRAIVARVPAKTEKTWGLRPFGGRLLIAEPFTGAALTSGKLSTTAPLAFGQVGGVLPEQKHATVTSADFGFNLGIAADFAPGEFYAIYLMMRAAQPLSFTGVNVSGFVAALSNQIAHPIGEWFGLGIVTRSQASAGTPRLRMQSATAGALDFGGLQVARFPNRLDAGEFMAEARFFMTEG
ncbi:glycosyl hydrolase family 28-related protein [Rubellimicrobium arenae]|uniref:glycosyl hydrolase family 28-related protein n=1 Tax=Rubellimicrobium arenae TaxID=2817372 RepID=UPI001B317C95|nr:glycosyl hydrolase family 28-related protein [Rubellimicrobium arenae]